MTMKTKLLNASAAALIAGAGAAHAVPQSVIDAIVDQLAAQGFSRIEIDIERNEIDVDAYGAGIEGDFTYSLSGDLLEADIDDSDDRGGRRTEVAYDDDDYEDDDRDDDYDDDDEDDDDDWSGDDQDDDDDDDDYEDYDDD